MRMLWLASIVAPAVLLGCSLPAPYQTYAPSTAPAPVFQTPNALMVYGQTTTFADMVPEANQVEPVPAPAASANTQQKSEEVAICYNRLWDSADAIKNAATQACGGGAAMSPRVSSQGLDLDACPLLTPTKAIFACGPSAIR